MPIQYDKRLLSQEIFTRTLEKELASAYNPIPAYAISVYKAFGRIIARDSDGVLIDSGAIDADDTQVLQAALNAIDGTGGILFLREGTYLVDALSISTKTDFTIDGGNAAKTILKCKTAGQAILRKNNTAVTQNIVIRNLTFDGDNKCNEQLNLATNTINALIENCIFTRSNHASPSVYISQCTNIVVRRCVFKLPNAGGDLIAIGGNRITVKDCDFSRTVSGGGLTSGSLTDAIIEGNYWHDFTGYAGLSLENFGNFENVVINGNTFRDCSSNPILHVVNAGSGTFNRIAVVNNAIYDGTSVKLYNAKHSVFANNVMYSCSLELNGIVDDFTIAHNIFETNRIVIWEDGAKQVSILGNIINGSLTEAIFMRNVRKLTISGNVIRDAGQGADNTYDAILLSNWSANQCQDASIIGNVIYSDHANKPRRCIGGSSPTNILITGNRLQGFSTAAVGFSGGTQKVVNNSGFATENKGTATVANGTTSITVNHACDYTPTAGDIIVTPTNNLGNAAKYWLSNITGSQFTINVDADPGATTATFAWQVRRV